MVAILSLPVSRKRLQTSGGSLGIVPPRASRIKDRISRHNPRAVSQVRARMKWATGDTKIPAINKPVPTQVYGFLFSKPYTAILSFAI